MGIQPHDIERIEMPYQEGDKIRYYSLLTWWNYTVTKMDPMKIKSKLFEREDEVKSDFSLHRPIEDYVPDTQIFVTKKFHVKSDPIERGTYLTVKENSENWITATSDGINSITIETKDLDKIIKTNHNERQSIHPEVGGKIYAVRKFISLDDKEMQTPISKRTKMVVKQIHEN